MSENEPNPEEYLDIAEKVRSGEYFREARAMYDLDVHDPMTDRYWYIILTVLSVIIMCISFSALQSLYPLKKSIPFIFGSNDIMEDLPRIKSLRQYGGEDADSAIQRFLIENYVRAREEYNIATLERNINAVQSQSATDVYSAYALEMDQSNPQSPVVLYQRQAIREITIISVRKVKTQEGAPPAIQVVYEAVLKGSGDEKPTRFQADVAFQYENIKLDESTNQVEPYKFLITGYTTRRL